jgi:hypothetical protein
VADVLVAVHLKHEFDLMAVGFEVCVNGWACGWLGGGGGDGGGGERVKIQVSKCMDLNQALHRMDTRSALTMSLNENTTALNRKVSLTCSTSYCCRAR